MTQFTCQTTREFILGYLRGTLSAQELVEFNDHLEDCEPCAEHVARLRAAWEFLGELPWNEISASADACKERVMQLHDEQAIQRAKHELAKAQPKEGAETVSNTVIMHACAQVAIEQASSSEFATSTGGTALVTGEAAEVLPDRPRVSRQRYPQGRKVVRCGVVGVGRTGSHHARLYTEADGAELVGVVDTDLKRRNEARDRWGIDTYQTVDELLAQHVDAVSIAVPAIYHRSVVTPLLEANVACLIDKPFAAGVERMCRRRW